MRRSLLLACALFAASACRVDDGFLDEDLFVCAGPSDCGEGWGCVRGSPYAVDFCAAHCADEGNAACDGICTEQDGRALCLRGCRFDEEGLPSDCPGEGFACIRASAETDEGICYPVDPCRGPADCAEGEVCLAQLVGLSPEDTESAGFYCVPAPDATGACPPRSQPVATGGGGSLCVATCDPPDTRCPPGFGCLLQSAVFADEGEDVLCFPGLYGVPCDDDTNCLLGRCLDLGGPGKQCTLACDEAARLAGSCGNLPSLADAVGALDFECDPSANDGEDGGLCVTRSSIGFLCTTPESNAYVCADGLECRSFPLADGGEVRLCTTECRIDQQCNRPGSAANYCLRTVGGGLCLPRQAEGTRCFDDGQCLSGRCADGVCAGGA
ncbi:MAG TPA: dickkopf-related protein [Polyangiaceae bacterium LLY-WYZ-15_(1-7)]|nr:hypothetical protein [Sandaracinus sp.]HJL05496.1 dickkopf-related protein [Polyangiaceae bacterium LLY-WYZ-15_(1-7)]HJL13737.1 dickkopf-related protein [Polyangiaceae bacterium LLY-WYZ-15_(1-7)]HJL45589.1 dickkopf-related protein [Polyangiaceae bacterium LLY-WYZ-15_(1-7)]